MFEHWGRAMQMFDCIFTVVRFSRYKVQVWYLNMSAWDMRGYFVFCVNTGLQARERFDISSSVPDPKVGKIVKRTAMIWGDCRILAPSLPFTAASKRLYQQLLTDLPQEKVLRTCCVLSTLSSTSNINIWTLLSSACVIIYDKCCSDFTARQDSGA